MKITIPRQRPPRRTLRRSFVSFLATAAALTAAAPASAANWYLSANQGSTDSWNSYAQWKSNADGTGTSATGLSANDTYGTNNKLLRTPNTTTDATFAGGTLELVGSSGVLALKTINPATAIVPRLKTYGGRIENYNGGITRLTVTDFEAVSGSTILTGSAAGSSTHLTVTNLIGSGELLASNTNHTAVLSVTNARGFTGQVRVTTGKLDFDAPWSSSGALVLDGGVTTLDQPVTVTSLKINGYEYPANTYNLSAFAAQGHGAYFASGSSGTITVKPPATWYLSLSQANPDNLETPTAWKANADGTGSSPTEIRAADTFDLNNFVGRTYFGTVSDRFDGGVLRSDSGSSKILIKTTGGHVTTIPYLRTIAVSNALFSSGALDHNSSGSVYVRVDAFENIFGNYSLSADSSNNRQLVFSVGRLFGPGQLTASGGGKFKISIDDATAFTGKLIFNTGTFDFDSDVDSTGSLEIASVSQVVVDQTVSFTRVVIGGIVKHEGTYTLSDLQAQHPTMTFTGTSTGKIIVRPPRDWYLSLSQTTGDWHTLANWNSASDGSGIAASSINTYDNYINSVSSRTLRTPDVSATFGGGALVLTSGSKLHLRAPSGQVTTIPALDTSGGATITNNGTTTPAQALVVTDWEVGSGITSLSVPSTETLTVSIDTLSGTGTLQTQGVGNYVLNLRAARKFTGTLRHFSGVLTFNSRFGTRGGLVVESAADVILNAPVYFTSATIAGQSLPPGTYSYATLRSNFPNQFPSGVGVSSAFLVVYTPNNTPPEPFLGVNLAGADSLGKHGETPFPGSFNNQWIYPNTSDWNYYAGRGFKLIRLPFRWERLQPVRGGALSNDELNRLKDAVAQAHARGMKVVLDMHNYAAWRPAGVSTTGILIGTNGVGIDQYAGVWRTLANEFKNLPGVYGYGIMNEPHDTGGTWPVIAQAAVDAIREVDITTLVIVPGDTWSNARGWRNKNPNLDTQDHVGRIAFEAHCYFDSTNSGDYFKSYADENGYPDIGKDIVREFVEWVKEKEVYGFVGEYGIPNTQWLPALNNFLAYLKQEGIAGTYWAGGRWWGSTDLKHCHPTNSYTTHRFQMATLQQYAP